MVNTREPGLALGDSVAHSLQTQLRQLGLEQSFRWHFRLARAAAVILGPAVLQAGICELSEILSH
jgi:hypothetical protein